MAQMTEMDVALAPPQEDEAPRKRTLETEKTGNDCQTVVRKKKEKLPGVTPKTVDGHGQRRPNKFKVIAANVTEAFRKISLLNEKFPNLNMTAKPNLKSE